MADKLRFMLTSLTQSPSQEVQGQLVGMSPSNANTWMHLLHPVLNHALADQQLLPARTADALTAMLTTSPSEPSAPSALFCMMGPNAPSTGRKTQKSSKNMTVGRKNATRSKTFS